MRNDLGMLRSQNQKHVTRAAGQLQINELNVKNVNVRTKVRDTVYCIYPLLYSVIYCYIKLSVQRVYCFVTWSRDSLYVVK